MHPNATLARTFKAFTINLPERTDRWSDFTHAWSDSALHFTRFPAISHMRKHKGTSSILVSGCAMSHHAVVTRSFAQDPLLPFILVTEDDAGTATFAQAFREILDYAMRNMDAWDIINLGTSMVVRGEEAASFEYHSHRLLRSTVWAGAHALLVNRRALPAYERMLVSVSRHDLSERAGRSDWTLSHDPFLVTLVSVPSIVRQVPGWSDMIGGHLDYTPLFDEADMLLVRARDALEQRSWRTGHLSLA